ncbi:MAG: Crp/Fnr family transcriptional regulator, partial [Terricaulis silvestris]
MGALRSKVWAGAGRDERAWAKPSVNVQLRDLRQFSVFRALNDEELSAIQPHVRRRPTRAGEIVHADIDPAPVFRLVASGVHRVTLMSPLGLHITLRTVRSGDCFGELCVLAEQSQNSYHIVADSDGCLLEIAGADLLLLIERLPKLGRTLMALIAEVALLRADRIFEFAALNTRARLQAELLRLAARGEQQAEAIIVRPAPTHESLATQIGTTREGVTRHLKSLRQLGFIRARRGEIAILDVDRLRAA